MQSSLQRSNTLLMTCARRALTRYEQPQVLDIGCGDGQRLAALGGGWGIEAAPVANAPAGVKVVAANSKLLYPWMANASISC